MDPRRRTVTTAVWSLAGLVFAEALGAAVLSHAVGWSWRQALDEYVVSNCAIGLSFALSGAVVASHRPRNPIGWLFLAGGVFQTATALTAPLAQLLHDHDIPMVAQRLVVTVFAASWPWSIGLCLPLFLLLFPDGHLVSPRWRWVAVAVVVTAPLFVAEDLGPDTVAKGMPQPLLVIPDYDRLSWLWTVAEIRTTGALLVGVVSLVVRYRRADDVQRRQLLWLLLAAVAVLGLVVPWSFVSGTPVGVLFGIPLVPAAVAIAILRYRLLDIRLVVARVTAWALLSGAALAGYVVVVTVLAQFVSRQVGRSALATVLIALLAAPVLPRLQRAVDRAMYGDRRDPASVVSRVSEQLTGAVSDGLPGVATAVRMAIKVPYVAVMRSGTMLAVAGDEVSQTRALDLEYGGESVGELVIGLRPGERDLSDTDRAVLALVAAPLAVAIHATVLSAELQASREGLVLAREDERRRLRRDLHDGLGPSLTGIALSADAASNLLTRAPAEAREILHRLGGRTRDAIAEVRRLVDDLRPAALDELGLLGALAQRVDELAWRSDGSTLRVRLEAPAAVPVLPAAVEAAAYRIATEALTNVVRHADASNATVRIDVADRLSLEVTDDGRPRGAWLPGVGLQSMRERATEVGGCFEAGPEPGGGRVFVSLPLGLS